MAVAHDTATRFPSGAGATDGTSGTRSFTHTPTNPPAGVCVVIQAQTTSAPATGVNYGGVAMTLRADATDTSEAGRVQVWTLTDVAIPAGAQTVDILGSPGAAKFAYCFTVTSATGYTTFAGAGNTGTTTSTNPSVTFTLSDVAQVYGGVTSGYIDVPTAFGAGSGMTIMDKVDNGSLGGGISRSTSTRAAGSSAYSWVVAQSDDWAIAAAGISETAAPAGRIPRAPAANFQDPALI